jgi:hypothetical protein
MQVLKDGSIRYSNVRIESVPTENFPLMVQLVKGPAAMRSIVGKKFINITKATLAIDNQVALNLIGKEKERVKFEMAENGIVSITEI